ncbi:hypothetical protein PO909_031113 [Leuciscus waleckii]
MFLFTWIIIQICMETALADTIQPLSSEKHIVEGKNVTLSCNYSATTGNVQSLQWYRANNGDTITPDKTQEFAAEGSSVKLSCSYSSAWSLLWYCQYPGSAPEFLVLISDTAKDVKPSEVDQRFTTKIRKEKQNCVDLEISSAEVSDSAVYYCALEPTVTGNTRTLYKNLLVFHSSGEMAPLNLELDTDPSGRSIFLPIQSSHINYKCMNIRKVFSLV